MYASRKEELYFATFCFCFYRKCRGVTKFQANKLKLLLVFNLELNTYIIMAPHSIVGN